MKKGFTLVELIIVLAIIAVVGSIIMQNFSGNLDKAKIRSDNQSAIVLNNAIDLYEAETKESFAEKYNNDVIDFLSRNNYIKKNSITEPQSGGKFEYNGGVVKAIVTNYDRDFKITYDSMVDDDKTFVVLGETTKEINASSSTKND